MTHRPRKRFGQNFLHDEQVIERIIACIAPKSSDLLIEIGPGQAALTHPLLESGAELHLIEIDRDLVMRLQDQIADNDNVTIHACDALQANFPEITGGRPFRLVGNLPYNISTPLKRSWSAWRRMRAAAPMGGFL
jgi:16S rRNA (adenine1518-N6/adenine1519-N6)-dimethyltransferase